MLIMKKKIKNIYVKKTAQYLNCIVAIGISWRLRGTLVLQIMR